MGTATLAIILMAATQVPPSTTSAPAVRRTYVQVVSAITRDVGVANYHRISPPLEGYALGLTVSVGHAISRSMAIEAEGALAGVVSRPQQFSYNWRENYLTENIDRFVSVLGRWTAQGANVSFVAGGGVTSATVNTRNGVRTYYLSPDPTPRPMPDRTQRYVALSLTGGMDAEIHLTPRVTLVPSGRVRWVNRPGDGMSFYAGSGGYVFQFGVGVRAAF